MLSTLIDTLLLGKYWVSLEMGATNGCVRTDKNLALMTWALPPNTNAGVYRPLSFLKYGRKYGWNIDAFCGETPLNQRQHGEELLSQIPSDVKIHVVQSPCQVPSYSLFPRIDGGFKNALAFARDAIRILEANPPSVVMASGPPFFSFVAAFFTARWFGVPLVLDYRDEWSQCPFDFVDKSGHDVWWERRCLLAASAVIFTTESHRRHQLMTFKELRESVTHVVPNGWEASDFSEQDNIAESAVRTNTTFTLAHVGNLAGHTPPHNFLNSLSQVLHENDNLRKLFRLQLIGRRSSEADSVIMSFPYKENIEIIDHVGKREANMRMRKADALLLIATVELQRYLPGKLFDYVAARRPILIFGSEGESSNLLCRLGVGVICEPNNPSKLLEVLQNLITSENIAENNKIEVWLDAHRRDVLARKAFDILELVSK